MFWSAPVATSRNICRVLQVIFNIFSADLSYCISDTQYSAKAHRGQQ